MSGCFSGRSCFNPKVCFFLLITAPSLWAADYPAPQSSDYVLHGFRFQSGEVLPELRMHYRTLGAAQRDEKGLVTNAVLILHGTTGNGSNFLRSEFAGELFGKEQVSPANPVTVVTRGSPDTATATWSKPNTNC